MYKHCFLLLAFIITANVFAKTTINHTDTLPEEPHVMAEEMPKFPGGDEALYKFIASNTHYPDSAKSKNIQGTVILGFVVEKDGTVNRVEILRGVRGGEDLNKEAIRVVKAMPKWAPGKNNGRVIPIKINIPIKFTLKDK